MNISTGLSQYDITRQINREQSKKCSSVNRVHKPSTQIGDLNKRNDHSFIQIRRKINNDDVLKIIMGIYKTDIESKATFKSYIINKNIYERNKSELDILFKELGIKVKPYLFDQCYLTCNWEKLAL